jgi:hypothetical protein
MNPRNLTLPLMLLALTSPVRGQTSPATDVLTPQPLNLSLPRDMTRPTSTTFSGDVANDPIERNLRSAQITGGKGTERLPYGSGYEARQRGMASGSSGSGAGRSGGGGGRGGMGRGR